MYILGTFYIRFFGYQGYEKNCKLCCSTVGFAKKKDIVRF